MTIPKAVTINLSHYQVADAVIEYIQNHRLAEGRYRTEVTFHGDHSVKVELTELEVPGPISKP